MSQTDFLPTAIPAARQLEFQSWERGLFLHFGIRTFYEGRRDWDGLPMEAGAFNPTELDCGQWAETAKAAGFNYMVLTAKHHDGFALWPSAFTDFSVAQSPWRHGQGDVVREYVEACREHGLKTGLYYSPADGSKDRCSSAKAYDDYFIGQVGEILTGYGEIDILWFDGCGSEGHVYDWERIVGEIRRMQPNVLIFELGDPDFRWAGNEAGIASRPLWNTTDRLSFSINAAEKVSVGPRPVWLPAECDFRMRELNWFYSDSDCGTVKSLDELLGLYWLSVGRGANMLINIGPDRRGLLPEPDRTRLLELGLAVERMFSSPLAVLEDAHAEGQSITWTFDRPVLLDCVVLEEDLADGEHVRSFTIEAAPHPIGEPVVMHEGRSVGRCALCSFPTVRTASLTVRISSDVGGWRMKKAGLHYTKRQTQ